MRRAAAVTVNAANLGRERNQRQRVLNFQAGWQPGSHHSTSVYSVIFDSSPGISNAGLASQVSHRAAALYAARWVFAFCKLRAPRSPPPGSGLLVAPCHVQNQRCGQHHQRRYAAAFISNCRDAVWDLTAKAKAFCLLGGTLLERRVRLKTFMVRLKLSF